jgi:tRNA splicing endonuclease
MKIIEKLTDRKNWTEQISADEIKKLMKENRDICEEKIKFLDSAGYIEERAAYPKWCLNKYALYQHLRKHGRVERCGHAEKVLKKMEQ